MKVVFRVDASLEIGTGHVMRCLTFAGALKEAGARCIFVYKEHPGNLLEFVRKRGFTANGLELSQSADQGPDHDHASLLHAHWLGGSWQYDAAQTLELISGESVDWLVVDHYALDHKWESKGTVVPAYGFVGLDVLKSFPIVVKPRRGRGSQSVRIIRDKNEMKDLAGVDLVWQQYLDPEDQEYTCAVYRSPRQEIRVLSMQRTLAGGLKGYGEVVFDSEIDTHVRGIADSFDFSRAMNIQLRSTKGGPVLFEINPRLSSTLVFHDKMSFCDLRWWLEDSVRIRGSEYVPPLHGTKFNRGSCEYIFEPS